MRKSELRRIIREEISKIRNRNLNEGRDNIFVNRKVYNYEFPGDNEHGAIMEGIYTNWCGERYTIKNIRGNVKLVKRVSSKECKRERHIIDIFYDIDRGVYFYAKAEEI